MFKDQNDLVVITGAASGIGKALAERYLKMGARVVALDINEEKLEKFQQENDKSKTKLKFYRVDVSQEEQVDSIAARIEEEMGKPALWINNAGIAVLGRFEKISPQDFKRVLSVNIEGVVNGTRAALSLMKNPERGIIVNVASLNGMIPAPLISPYVTAKYAVVGFTRALRLELEQSGSPIRLILVSPGFVRTPIMESNPDIQLPHWLGWLVEEPRSVAIEIIRGISKGKKEIIATTHGRVLQKMHRLAPELIGKSSRLLVARSWKELLGLFPIQK